MRHQVGQRAQVAQPVERVLQRPLAATGVEHLLAQALYTRFQVQQACGHRCQHIAHRSRQQCWVYLQMETHARVKLLEQPQQRYRMLRVIVERTVQHTHIAYAPLADAL